MTLRPLVVVAIVLALASCARMAPPGGDPRSPRVTNVTVVEAKYIVIDQEPIIVHGRDVVLIWRIDSSETWRFPQTNAIVFPEAPGEFGCNTNGNGTQVQCVDRGTLGKYKYNITLVRGTETPLKLDPFVWNL